MDSVWLKIAEKSRFDRLEGNKTTDVLIVGGGIVGILCAYKLKESSLDCLLVEANEICGGIKKTPRQKSPSVTG